LLIVNEKSQMAWCKLARGPNGKTLRFRLAKVLSTQTAVPMFTQNKGQEKTKLSFPWPSWLFFAIKHL